MFKLRFKETTVKGYPGKLSLKRNEHGVPCIKGGSRKDLYFGLGWIHAYERLVAMELTRLVAKGCAAEHLDPKLLKLDITMRRLNLWRDSKSEAKKLVGETLEMMEAYCSGINKRLSSLRLPFEFKLIGYKPEPWTPSDCILMTKMMGIVDMTETQGWMEKFIIHMLQQGVSFKKVKELFPYITEELDDDYLNIIRQVRVSEPIVPETVKWSVLPRFQSSNAWAVSGVKTASGSPIVCGDPHLDTARLPAIWQEVIMQTGDYFFIGATVPGIPAPALGRTNNLAWSPTYAFMDVIDYFIEDVKDEHYRKGDRWLPFRIREETIKVKKGQPVKVRFYENEHGVLEQEPDEDGYYLCFAWTAMRDCGAESIDNGARYYVSTTVKEAMRYFAGLDFAAFNWVIADKEGNIGYQMSGRSPVRREGCSGLLPMPGWDEEYDWHGYRDRNKNPSFYNPSDQIVVSANHDMNWCVGTNVSNLPMAPYRAQRITEMLKARDDHTVDSMKEMQYDLRSKQAEEFMEKIRPLLPADENGKLLRDWDLRYDSHSLAPTLFESIYEALAGSIFGTLGFGSEAFDYFVTETILFQDFYGNFDRIMLSDDSEWFNGKTGKEILKGAIEKGLQISPKPYGSNRKIMMKNLLLGGRLPRFLGFDYGPIELIGGRATIPQGQVFRSFGRLATYSPSYKFITDFKEEDIHSAMAGGPSDRRFSRWYTSGIKDWLKGKYRIMKV